MLIIGFIQFHQQNRSFGQNTDLSERNLKSIKPHKTHKDTKEKTYTTPNPFRLFYVWNWYYMNLCALCAYPDKGREFKKNLYHQKKTPYTHD